MWLTAALGLVDYLRSPATAGNAVAEGEPTLGDRFRKLSSQLARAWAVCAGNESLAHLRTDVQFYENVRVYMAKYDAEERRAHGEPVPEEIARLLRRLVAQATATATGEILDIYEAAGLTKPSLMQLGPEYAAHAQSVPNPHLAIEALRAVLTEESARVAGTSLVRQRAFSERLAELMRKDTNQQLTSADVIAELIDMAQDLKAAAGRGARHDPPLDDLELPIYDALADKRTAEEVLVDEVLADMARRLVVIMRRDVKTDWTVRDDVRAKLRSMIRRERVRVKYPSEEQGRVISLVMEQMEYLAPRLAA